MRSRKSPARRSSSGSTAHCECGLPRSDALHASGQCSDASAGAHAALRSTKVGTVTRRRPVSTTGRASATGTTSRRCGTAASARRLRASRRASVAARRVVQRDRVLQADVADRQHVGAQLVEHQEHLRGPAADALDVDQRLDQRLVVERRPRRAGRARRTRNGARGRAGTRPCARTARSGAASACACAPTRARIERDRGSPRAARPSRRSAPRSSAPP